MRSTTGRPRLVALRLTGPSNIKFVKWAEPRFSSCVFNVGNVPMALLIPVSFAIGCFCDGINLCRQVG